MVSKSSQNLERKSAQDPFSMHTVYTLPRTVQWHVEQRMPEAIEAALRRELATVADAFAKSGLDFVELVTMSYKNSPNPDVVVEFGDTEYEQITYLGRLLSKLFGDLRAADEFDTKELSGNAAARAIASMLRNNLCLNNREFDALKESLAVQVKRDIPASALKPAETRPDRSDWAGLLEGADGPLPLLGPQTMHSIDVLIATVFARAPWMNHPLTKIWSLMKVHQGNGLRFPPLLLYGPGGTGKSMLARLIAEASATPSLEMDGSAGSAGFRIAGVEIGWSSARIGEPLRFIAEQRCANPIMVLNEVDKAVGGTTSSSGVSTSLVNALLPLLDPHSAQQFRCPASQLVCDMSRINWILTANDVSALSQPFLSRLELIHIPSLTEQQYIQALDVLCPNDELLIQHLHHLIAEEWRNPNFSLRTLARAIQRLRTSEQPVLQ